jgi:hypothetical protein
MSVKRSNLTIINICDKDNSPTHTSLLVLKSRYFTRASFELAYTLQATRALLTKLAVTTSCPIQLELSCSGNCHPGICNKQPENCEHHTHRRTKCEPFKTRATRHQFLPLYTQRFCDRIHETLLTGIARAEVPRVPVGSIRAAHFRSEPCIRTKNSTLASNTRSNTRNSRILKRAHTTSIHRLIRSTFYEKSL